MDRALLERMIGAIALVLLLVIVAPALLDGARESSSARLSDAQDSEDVRTEIIVLNEPRDPEILLPPTPAADPLQAGIIAGKRPAPAAKSEEASSSDVSTSSPAEKKSKTAVVTPSQVPTQVPAPAKVSAIAPAPQPAIVAKEPAVASRPVAKAPAVPSAAPELLDSTPVAAEVVKAGGFAVQLGSFGQAENARKYAAELSSKGFASFVRSGSTATGATHRVYAGPRPSRDAAEQLASVLGSAGYRGIVVDLSAGNGTR